MTKCPHCGLDISPAAMLGSKKKTMTPAAIAARRENGKKGGRPSGRPKLTKGNDNE